MKTFEFIKKTEMLGFYVVCQDDAIYVRISGLNKHWIMRIGNEYCGDIKADFNDVKWKFDFKALYELAVDYAFTPIEEREDEPKKYAIRLLSGDTGYLNYNKDTSLCIDTAGIESNWGPYQCFFTEQEYNRIRKNELQAGFTFLPKFDPDNTKVFVPVEDEDEDE
jgi:hypothetical protein